MSSENNNTDNDDSKVHDQRDMKLKDAEKTIANKDVIIKMLQEQVKKLEESYKRNLKETENFRYRFCMAAEQVRRLRECTSSGVKVKPTQCELSTSKQNHGQMHGLVESCLAIPAKCSYIQQIKNIENFMRAHHELLQQLMNKMSDKRDTDRASSHPEKISKETHDELVSLYQEIDRLKSENNKLRKELHHDGEPDEDREISPSILLQPRDSILETYRRNNQQLQKQVSSLLEQVLSTENNSTLLQQHPDSFIEEPPPTDRRISFSAALVIPPDDGSEEFSVMSEIITVDELSASQMGMQPKLSSVSGTPNNRPGFESPSAEEDPDSIEMRSRDNSSFNPTIEAPSNESPDAVPGTNAPNTENVGSSIGTTGSGVDPSGVKTIQTKKNGRSSNASDAFEIVGNVPIVQTVEGITVTPTSNGNKVEETPVTCTDEKDCEEACDHSDLCPAVRNKPKKDVTCTPEKDCEEICDYPDSCPAVRNKPKEDVTCTPEKDCEEICDYPDSCPAARNKPKKDVPKPLDSQGETQQSNDYPSELDKPSKDVPKPLDSQGETQQEDTDISIVNSKLNDLFSKLNDISDKVLHLLQQQSDTSHEIETLKKEITASCDITQTCIQHLLKLAKTINEQKEMIANNFQQQGTATEELHRVNKVIQAELEALKMKVQDVCHNIKDLKHHRRNNKLMPNGKEHSISEDRITVEECMKVISSMEFSKDQVPFVGTVTMMTLGEPSQNGPNSVKMDNGQPAISALEPQKQNVLEPQEQSESKPQERRVSKTQEESESKPQERRVSKTQEESELKPQERRVSKTQEESELKPQERRVSQTQEHGESQPQERRVSKTQEQSESKPRKGSLPQTQKEGTSPEEGEVPFERIVKKCVLNDGNHDKVKCVTALLSYWKEVHKNCPSTAPSTSAEIQKYVDEHLKLCNCGNDDIHRYIDKIAGENVKLKTTISNIIDHLNRKLNELKESEKETESDYCICPDTKQSSAFLCEFDFCQGQFDACVNPTGEISDHPELEIEDIYNAVRRTVKPQSSGFDSSTSCLCSKINNKESSTWSCTCEAEDACNSYLCICDNARCPEFMSFELCQKSNENQQAPCADVCHSKHSCDLAGCTSKNLITSLETYVSYLHEQLDIISHVENQIEDLRHRIKTP